MSLVMSVHTSFSCAHGCDDDIGSSRSDASSKASMVLIVCSISSRIASRTVSAFCSSPSIRHRMNLRPLTQWFCADRNTGDLRVLRSAIAAPHLGPKVNAYPVHLELHGVHQQ